MLCRCIVKTLKHSCTLSQAWKSGAFYLHGMPDLSKTGQPKEAEVVIAEEAVKKSTAPTKPTPPDGK